MLYHQEVERQVMWVSITLMGHELDLAVIFWIDSLILMRNGGKRAVNSFVEFLRSINSILDERTEGDRFDFLHESKDVSSLWSGGCGFLDTKNESIDRFYSFFDGGDLFSSSFKLSSLREPKYGSSGVQLVDNLQNFGQSCVSQGCRFPLDATPFMTQSGIWHYAYDGAGVILAWDVEESRSAGEYGTIEEIIKEWAESIF